MENNGLENKYDCVYNCIKCGGYNKLINADYLDEYCLMECNTECSKCGHKAFWAHGFFESMGG